MKVIPDPTGPGQESVWSYPRPAVAEPSQRRLKIVHRDVIIAEHAERHTHVRNKSSAHLLFSTG